MREKPCKTAANLTRVLPKTMGVNTPNNDTAATKRMHINYTDDNDIKSIDIEPRGNERKEIEQAAKRQYDHKDNQTALVRATLVAADAVNLNNAHFHAREYQKLAENIEVSRGMITKNGLEYVRVDINNDN